MKRVHALMFGLMLSVSVSGVPAAAQELTKEAKIERILALTKADAIIDQMLSQMKALMASQMPADTTPEDRARQVQVQGKMADAIKGLMAKIRPQQIKIYNDIFSDDEINGLLAFYESPAGRSYLAKMPLIMSQMMIAVQADMKDFQAEIQGAVQESPKR
jgi:hypothetical protein